MVPDCHSKLELLVDLLEKHLKVLVDVLDLWVFHSLLHLDFVDLHCLYPGIVCCLLELLLLLL